MTFFGRPVSSVFNRSVGFAAAAGFLTGAAESYFLHGKDDEHRVRHAVTQGALWGGMDAGLEIGLNAFFPGARGKTALQSALVESAIQGVSGAVTGYATAKMTDDEHPFRRAAITSAEWAVMDGIGEYAINSVFPGLRGNR